MIDDDDDEESRKINVEKGDTVLHSND